MAEAFPANSDSDFSDEDPLDTSFNKAADHVKKITANLNNNQLLELYGLYKQSTEGKCNTTRPGWFDGRGQRKWDAWKSVEDLPSDEAKTQYIALVQKYDPELTVDFPGLDGKNASWAAVSSMQYSPEPELVPNELSLLDAARENCAERVTELLEKNPELKHKRDEDGLTALHWAADRDALDALTAALKGGCLIDATDQCGQTALHYAAACGHLQSTRALVNAGATMVRDNEDCIPLDLTSDDEIKKILEGAAIF